MERENREVLLKDPRAYFISLSEADGYAHTDQEILIKNLKDTGHFSREYLYSAFNIRGIYRLLETGTYRVSEDPQYNAIYCCHIKRDAEERLVIGTFGYGDDDLIHYLTLRGEGEKDAAFVVFEANALKEVATEQYEFVNPDNRQEALVAVYIVENFFEY